MMTLCKENQRLPNHGYKPIIFRTIWLILLMGMWPLSAQFLDVTQAKGLGNYHATSGHVDSAGGVFADVNQDRFPDLVLIANEGREIHIYRNIQDGFTGKRRFASPFVINPGSVYGRAVGAVASDYDNDGDLDLYVVFHAAHFDKGVGDHCLFYHVCSSNVLYANNSVEENLAFADVTNSTTCGTSGGQNAGVGHSEWVDEGESRFKRRMILDNSLTATWGDVNRDGYLDLFVGNHVGDAQNPESGLGTTFDYYGQRDILLINGGPCDPPWFPGPVFNDRTADAGVNGFNHLGNPSATKGKNGQAIQIFSSTVAAMFTDLNGDLWPDLIVMNKAGGATDADAFYLNRGQDRKGKWLGFEYITHQITPPPLASHFGTVSHGARALDTGDFDLDGDLDLYIGDQTTRSTPPNEFFTNLYAPMGPVDFQLEPQLGAVNSWGVRWFDANLDGRLDLFVGAVTGQVNHLYIQNPTGSFANNAAHYGVDTDLNPRAVLKADYDLDGDLDLFVIHLNPNGSNNPQPSVLWENQASGTRNANHFLNIKLVGNPDLSPTPYRSTKDAIGAKVRVTGTFHSQDPQTQTKEVLAGSGHGASSSSMVLNFGLGMDPQVDVDVLWPSGRIYHLKNVAANQFLQIEEQAAPVVWSITESFEGSGPLSTHQNTALPNTWHASNLQLSNGQAIPQGLGHPLGYRLLADVKSGQIGVENVAYTYTVEATFALKKSGLVHIGLSANSLEPYELGTSNLFFEFQRSGKLRLLQNGTHKIAGPFHMNDLFGTEWQLGDPLSIKMVFDAEHRMVHLFVGLQANTQHLLMDSIPLASGEPVPISTYAGFQARRANPHAVPPQIFETHHFTMDAFTATITDNRVPVGAITIQNP